jgi:leucine dehydrogenase
MAIFEHAENYDHEQVVFCRNDSVGLRAIIAVHDTTLGPALGGCRFYPYAKEEDAVRDVLRLSRGMTYKAACAGLDLGGGKSVILGDPRTIKSEGLLRAFGQYVESLGGRYITAEDSGTCVADMDMIAKETSHVCGASPSAGGSGDPSPVTAWGVFHGIKACLEEQFGSKDVKGRKVAIQGVGNVGLWLLTYLVEEGATVVVADVDRDRLERARQKGASDVVATDSIHAIECDVFSPNAMGAILNDRTIPEVRAPIIAGGANNQLDHIARHGDALVERGILYAPDYVINAGGLINVSAEIHGSPAERAREDAARIFQTLRGVFAIAKRDGLTTTAASNRLAEERIRTVAGLRAFHR